MNFDMGRKKLILGQTLGFNQDPFFGSIQAATAYNSSGAIYIKDGLISDLGNRTELLSKYRDVPTFDYSNYLLTAGMIDSHAHYPQTRIIASWGARLIEWLNTYTFPEEEKFGDIDYARQTAEFYIDTLLKNGITTASTFCTIHPVSVDAIFESALSRGMRIVAGKTCMDRNAPPGLLDTVNSGYDDSKRLLERWHNKDRLSYAISPRFAPTSSAEQLEALGSLWQEYPDCLMQTHLSEQVEEIAWVGSLFPSRKDYLDVYQHFNLLGKRGLYGHCIHLSARELDRLKEVEGKLIHCPTSNLFIGSGLFRTWDRKADGLNVGLATDTGGGSSFSMFRVMASAYEVSQLCGHALHPSQLFWLATVANAQALHMEDTIGNLQIGLEADIIAIDLYSTEVISQRSKDAENIWDKLFPTIMMGNQSAIRNVWVAGNEFGDLSRN